MCSPNFKGNEPWHQYWLTWQLRRHLVGDIEIFLPFQSLQYIYPKLTIIIKILSSLYLNQLNGHCDVLGSPMIARGSRACNRNHKPSKQRLVLIESLARSELTTRKCRKRDPKTGFFSIEAMFAKTSLARASQNAAAVQSYQVRSNGRLETGALARRGCVASWPAKWAKYSNLVSGSLMIFNMTSSWNPT